MRLLAKGRRFLYRRVMRVMVRHILAFCLTIALIAGGVPFAHAMPSVVPVAPAVQDAHMRQHDAGHVAHHQVQHVVGDSQHDAAPGRTAQDLCKGLKCCSMCATAYVEPSLRTLDVERVSFAVRYDALVIAQPQGVTFVDPGIPIV